MRRPLAEREADLRIEAARDHLNHALAGDVLRLEAIHHARRLLAAAERMLKRRAA